jgi:2-hydroxychromene-2-carboxylate isomerase
MIELWFDFSCPYAFLASRRARQLGLEIDWRPMLLGGVFRGTGAGDGPMATLSPQKQAHNFHDMHRWADVFGEPFRMPAAHPIRTVQALRTLLALPQPWWPAAIEALFAAYWQRGDDISSPEIIARTLRAAGVAEAAVAAAAGRADDPAIKEDLRRRTDEAIALGIFGAPAWIVRDRPSAAAPLLVWGQDRMAWVDAMLAGWDLTGPPPGGPRPFAPAEPAVAGKTLDVYFDVASPFAYLALTQLPALIQPGVTARLLPILVGALFREIGQVDVPLLAMPDAKRRYVSGEMQRWASWRGVPFDLPRKFPQRTIAAQRLCILAARDGIELGIRTATALARGMWAEQLDLEDAAMLREILDGAGIPDDQAERWLVGTQDPAIKAQLAANTSAAKAAGVFGVPTFVVDGSHLFWGQDRIELVARALAGWAVPAVTLPARPGESADGASR